MLLFSYSGCKSIIPAAIRFALRPACHKAARYPFPVDSNDSATSSDTGMRIVALPASCAAARFMARRSALVGRSRIHSANTRTMMEASLA